MSLRLIRCRSCLLVIALFLASPLHADDQTALDRYVAKADPSYAFKLVNTIKSPGATTFVLELTSQTWLTEKEVDRPIWKHWLTIVRPDNVKTSKGLMIISGGSNDRPAPKSAPVALLLASAATDRLRRRSREFPASL